MIVLPETVRVKHLDYAIVMMTREESGTKDGDVCFNSCVIRIYEGLSDVLMLETLLHEIKHVMFHTERLDDKSKEEEVVDKLIGIELAVWRDNPELKQLLDDYCNK